MQSHLISLFARRLEFNIIKARVFRAIQPPRFSFHVVHNTKKASSVQFPYSHRNAVGGPPHSEQCQKREDYSAEAFAGNKTGCVHAVLVFGCMGPSPPVV
jgi:hypothetical protein